MLAYYVGNCIINIIAQKLNSCRKIKKKEFKNI